MRPSLLPRIAAALLAIQLPVAVGAALVHDDEPHESDADTEVVDGDLDRDGDVEADDGVDALAQAAEQTAAATHYRYEMAMEFGGPDGVESFGGVLATGAVAGDRHQFILDQGGLFDQIGGGPATGDLTMEIITDPTMQYIRAPLYAALAAEGSDVAMPPEMQPLIELGDGWGRIDLAAVGAATGIPDELMGQSGLDPEAAIEILRSAAGSAESTGTGEERGVAVTHYAAAITFDELAGGMMDADDIRAFMPALPEDMNAPGFDEIFDAMLAAPIELTVSIGDDGLVRRLTMDLSKSFLAVGEAMGEDIGDDLGLDMTQSIDFFAYGDQSIVIEPPPIEETVDLTAWALEMADAFS